MKTPLFAIIVSGLITGCAYQSHSTAPASGAWPFSITGQLSDAEITQITKAIEQTPEIDHHIVQIQVRSPHRIEVLTGRIYGPLAGGGNVVTMKKQKKKWRVIGNPSSSTWDS